MLEGASDQEGADRWVSLSTRVLNTNSQENASAARRRQESRRALSDQKGASPFGMRQKARMAPNIQEGNWWS